MGAPWAKQSPYLTAPNRQVWEVIHDFLPVLRAEVAQLLREAEDT